jgi:hypothetical protein
VVTVNAARRLILPDRPLTGGGGGGGGGAMGVGLVSRLSIGDSLFSLIRSRDCESSLMIGARSIRGATCPSPIVPSLTWCQQDRLEHLDLIVG